MQAQNGGDDGYYQAAQGEQLEEAAAITKQLKVSSHHQAARGEAHLTPALMESVSQLCNTEDIFPSLLYVLVILIFVMCVMLTSSHCLCWNVFISILIWFHL